MENRRSRRHLELNPGLEIGELIQGLWAGLSF